MSKLSANERILSEDALKHIYACEQDEGRPTLQSVAGVLQVTLDRASHLINKMATHNLLRMKGDTYQLTAEGRDYALQIVRAHRLWERYLADETGFAKVEWHDRADRHEHTLSPAETEALSARLGHPTHDPHGDPIPTANGNYVPHGGQPLTTLSEGQAARIVHLEDEPEIVYAQLVAEGLSPGMDLYLTEISSRRLCFWADGNEHILAPIVATNISVVPIRRDETIAAGPSECLADLQPGQKGRVINISPACEGPARRRFMDLGILPGTVITAELKSPSGDPTAYNIRDALIALRQDQAKLINISRLKEVKS